MDELYEDIRLQRLAVIQRGLLRFWKTVYWSGARRRVFWSTVHDPESWPEPMFSIPLA